MPVPIERNRTPLKIVKEEISLEDASPDFGKLNYQRLRAENIEEIKKQVNDA